MAVDSLRNRANAKDRPDNDRVKLREVPLVNEHSNQPHRCKQGEGHSHVFQVFDRYGCCKVCGDEVLT